MPNCVIIEEERELSILGILQPFPRIIARMYYKRNQACEDKLKMWMMDRNWVFVFHSNLILIYKVGRILVHEYLRSTGQYLYQSNILNSQNTDIFLHQTYYID